jgi:hypothetical protein
MHSTLLVARLNVKTAVWMKGHLPAGEAKKPILIVLVEFLFI